VHHVARKVPIEELGVERTGDEREYHHRGQQPQQAQPGPSVAGDHVEPGRVRPELRVPEAPGQLVEQPGHDSANDRSVLRSSMDSIPTLNRTRSSVIPSSARRSGGTLAWVITAGWFTRLSTPPSDSASVNSSVRSQK